MAKRTTSTPTVPTELIDWRHTAQAFQYICRQFPQKATDGKFMLVYETDLAKSARISIQVFASCLPGMKSFMIFGPADSEHKVHAEFCAALLKAAPEATQASGLLPAAKNSGKSTKRTRELPNNTAEPVPANTNNDTAVIATQTAATPQITKPVVSKAKPVKTKNPSKPKILITKDEIQSAVSNWLVKQGKPARVADIVAGLVRDGFNFQATKPINRVATVLSRSMDFTRTEQGYVSKHNHIIT